MYRDIMILCKIANHWLVTFFSLGRIVGMFSYDLVWVQHTQALGSFI
ncbi:MAG: hypothetical protein R6U84_09930 [Candidatus Cloacimonadales bacterium]